MKVTPRIDEALASPNNNFTIIRLGLALAVVVSHAFSVTNGQVFDEPLMRSTGYTLGEHAVNGFFAISGFLVTMSFDRRGIVDYVLARFLRIAPALVAATLLIAFVLGAAMTDLDPRSYFDSPDLWRFVMRTLLEFKSTLALPGVFADNPFQFPMGTVWTLKYEVLCYLGLLLLGAVGLLRWRPGAVFLVLALAFALTVLDYTREVPKSLETALRLPMIFATGSALYLWRGQVRLSFGFVALFAILTAATMETPLYAPILFIGSAYIVLFLALAPVLTFWRKGTSEKSSVDLSYGTYLYGWPVQQTLTALYPTATATILLAPSLAVTLVIACFSWFFIEKPALALKARLIANPRGQSHFPPKGGRSSTISKIKLVQAGDDGP